MKQIILALIVTLNWSLILATPLTIINNGASEEIIAGDAIIQDGVIICDLVVCPSNSFTCSVGKKSIDNNQNILTTRNCSAENGDLLLQNQTTTPNPNPGNVVNTYNSANKNGQSVNCGDCSNSAEAVAEAQAEAAETVARVIDGLNAGGIGPAEGWGAGLANSIVNNVLGSLAAAGI